MQNCGENDLENNLDRGAAGAAGVQNADPAMRKPASLEAEQSAVASRAGSVSGAGASTGYCSRGSGSRARLI